MLKKEVIIAAIQQLSEKYNIAKVDLFGSYATGVATEKSDIDLLVTFNAQPPSIFKVMGFKSEMSSILNIPVDIVTMPLANPDVMSIERTVNVYDRA